MLVYFCQCSRCRTLLIQHGLSSEWRCKGWHPPESWPWVLQRLDDYSLIEKYLGTRQSKTKALYGFHDWWLLYDDRWTHILWWSLNKHFMMIVKHTCGNLSLNSLFSQYIYAFSSIALEWYWWALFFSLLQKTNRSNFALFWNCFCLWSFDLY